MAKVTLSDLSKVFKDDKKPSDFHYYGQIVSVDAENRTYEVSINRDESITVEAARLVGAGVGDTVMVTVMANGYATVTGRVGGDMDASDAQRTADNASTAASSALSQANSAVGTATQAQTRAGEALNIANDAVELAEQAEEEAGRASTAAEQAAASASIAEADAARAATSAQNAEADASSASTSAQNAAASASSASTSAQNAARDAASAATSASNAESDASSAASSAQSAASDASSASSSATAAAADAATASQQASAATTAANQAKTQAQAAETAATEAKADASSAKRDAAAANTAANGAVAGLAVVQGVVDQLETDVDDMQTHVAMMNAIDDGDVHIPAGLHVVPSASGYFMVIANDGVYVYDNESVLVAKYGHNIVYDSNREHKIGNNTSYIRYYDSNNDGVADAIEIVADNIRLGSYSVGDKITATETTLNNYMSSNNTRVGNVETSVTTTTTNLTNYITSNNQAIESLERQIDGAIDTWYYSGVPTLNNDPAINWPSNTYESHERDLYFDTSTGHTYRFARVGNTEPYTYEWIEIQDADALRALQAASAAQDTADHKRRVFVTTPAPPYEIGDLWVQGQNGDIFRCATPKTSQQSYDAADWVKASKYTDDTKANSVETDLHTNYYVKSDFSVEPDKIASTISATETTVKTYADGKANTAKQEAIADAATKYYTKTQTYTKSEIEQKAGEISLSVAQEETAKVISVKEANGSIVHIDDAIEYPALSLTANIVPKQSGSGTPSPENIRPISGWESVEVFDTGVNVWDEEWEEGYLTNDGQNRPYAGRIRAKNYIGCKPNTQYYFKSANYSSWYLVCFYNADKESVGYLTPNSNNTFTTPIEAYYMRFALNDSYGTTYNHDISINYPSTDHDYHAYVGTTHTTSLGRTVYGGTVDVVTGVLTVDRGFATFDGDENFSAGSSGMPFRVVLPSDLKVSTNSRQLAGIVSNQMTEVTQASTWGTVGTCSVVTNGTSLYFKLAEGLTDISELRTYLASNPLQICYPLAEPQTYTLTPQTINTLAGVNNVWADSGDVYLKYATMNPDMQALMNKSNDDLSRAKAEIKVTTDAIESTVSNKVGNNEVISKINQSAESVKIQANRVEIDGTVTFNAIKSQADAAYDSIGSASTAEQNAKAAALSRSQRIYYRSTSIQNSLSGPTTWLSTSGTGYGNWSLSIPQLTNGEDAYPYLYTCVQNQTAAQYAAGSVCTCTPVVRDDSTTVIDGGSITTGVVSANYIDAAHLQIGKGQVDGLSEYMSYMTFEDGVLKITKPGFNYSVEIRNDGVYIVDPNNHAIASYKDYITLGTKDGNNIDIRSDSINFNIGNQTYAYVAQDKWFASNAEVSGAMYIDDYSLRQNANGDFVLGRRK